MVDIGNMNPCNSIMMPDLSNPIYGESEQAVYAGVSKQVAQSNVNPSNNPLSINRSKKPFKWSLYTVLSSLFRWILCVSNFRGLRFKKCKENIGIDYRIFSYDPSSTPTRIDNRIQINHFGCKVEAIINQWPEKYKSIKFFQFCKLDHQIIHGNCTCSCKSKEQSFCVLCQILHKYVFYKVVLDRNSPEGYVLDSCNSDQLSYAEISKNEHRGGKKMLEFSDQPQGFWNVEHENYPLHKIDKKQNFLLYLVGIKEDDQMDVLKSWEWGYDMDYCNGNLVHKPREPVETDKKLLNHLNYLPNANNCIFRVEYSNKSMGKADTVVEYPKILSDGLTMTTFEEKIINNLNKSLFKQYLILILSAIIQYLSKLIFLLFIYLIGMKENDQMDVLRSWEWGYNMDYCNGNLVQKPRESVQIDKELPNYLPNANNCIFRVQYSNKSMGKLILWLNILKLYRRDYH